MIPDSMIPYIHGKDRERTRKEHLSTFHAFLAYFWKKVEKGEKNMDDLIVSGKQSFMGKEIPVVLGGFGEGKKCICDKTIAEIHNQPVPEIRRRINDNISRFKENIDFIDLKKGVGESHTLSFALELGYTKSAITQAEHIYLLSERGYAKLIKIMDTDFAWEIHDKLIDEYFELRELQANMSDLSTELQLLIKMELRQKEQDKQILSMQDNIKRLEARMTTHNEDYFTIAGYASLRGLNVDINMANMLGRKASKVSRKYGYEIGKM